MNDNERKEYVKEHKKQILIGVGGGVALLVGAFLIGKKIGKGNSLMLSRQVGNLARDIKVTQPIPLPEGVSKIWKQIDEDVFVDVASNIENALIDMNIDTLHLDRNWEVADGVIKNLVVEITTDKK